MPFPESPREIYKRNPLREVICQLRFPTILQVAAQSPSQFQNAVRKRYPLYEEEHPMAALPKELSDLLAGLPVPIPKGAHKFLTEDRTRFISLSQGFLAAAETNYRQWERFREEIERAEDAFRKIYEPAFYSRIGLRYLDVLDRDALGLGNRRWADLLNSSLLGELAAREIAEEVEEVLTQSRVRLSGHPNSFVQIRHGLAREGDGKRPVYVIDADFFTEQRSEASDVFEILDGFNKLAGNLFRWAITPVLREALEPNRV